MSENTYGIRKENPADYSVVGDIHREAFGEQHGEDVATLVDRIRNSDRYVDDFSLVAEGDNGEVLGHVLLSYVDLVGSDGEVKKILALSPLGIAKSHQKEGIGGALVNKALEVAEDRGESLVTLEGIPEYYPRFGFEPAAEMGIHYPEHVPTEAAMVRRLKDYDPNLRGHVRYPEAFDHLEPHATE